MKKMFSIVFIADSDDRKDADRMMDRILDLIEEKYRHRNIHVTNHRVKDLFER